MLERSISYSFIESQEKDENVVCILCEGTHGNNTWCQYVPSQGGEVE